MAAIELFLRRSVHQQIIVVHFVSVFKYAKVRLMHGVVFTSVRKLPANRNEETVIFPLTNYT